MATISYQAVLTGWTADININYETSYDPATNRTTVTFLESSYAYFGRSGYGTSASTAIQVTAEDNGGSYADAAFNISGTTDGGVKTFSGTPSPASVVVQHAAGSGKKSVKIECSSTVWAYMTSTATSQWTATGRGSASITSATAYTLTKSQGEGTTLGITVASSPFRSAGTNIGNGGLIYAGETLKVTFSAQAGYKDPKCTVSGVGSVSNGRTFSVSGNCTVTTTATKTPYTLTYSVGSGIALVVTRGGSALASGATIYYGDTLNISFAAQTGYEVASATLNGKNIESPSSHTVTGDTTIVIDSALLSSAWLCIDGIFKRYFINIFIQGAWRRCREKIFSGGGGTQAEAENGG